MSNPLLGQVLANVLGRRLGAGPGMTMRGGAPGGLGGGLGGAALGGVLAGMLGRSRGARAGGNRGLLLAMLLPLAMRWVQRNGGIGAVLDRFRQNGMGRQADSWVSTDPNHAMSAQDVQRVVGTDDISRFASQLGVPEDEVAQAFAEIMPELTDQLTPEGRVAPHADAALEDGQKELESALAELHADSQQLP